jgi:hypothetical protein
LVKEVYSGEKDISSIYPNLEKCCDAFFDEKEKSYLFPLITGWSGSDRESAHWFKNEKISALGEKTGMEVCRNNQQKDFLHYIRHIENEGFA